MVVPIIMAIWYGYRAKIAGRNIFIWAIAGAVIVFIISSILVNSMLYLAKGSIDSGDYLLISIFARILGFVITFIIGFKIVQPQYSDIKAPPKFFKSDKDKIINLDSIFDNLNNTNALITLIEKGADINTANTDGQTPLIVASKLGEEKTVELLLSKKANVFHRDKHNSTALHEAIKNNYSNIAELLIKNKANINAIDNDTNTPILIALKNGNKDVSKLLLSYDDIDVFTKNKLGDTTLSLALKNGYNDIVELLKNKGVN